MMLRKWNEFCLCGEAEMFPAGSVPVEEPFSPLVFLVRREGLTGRGLFAIQSLGELYEDNSVECLLPCRQMVPEDRQKLEGFVRSHGACVLNTAFVNCFSYLRAYTSGAKKKTYRVTLVGLGDVGGTVLTGLKLLGHELSEIAVYDPNEALCARYEMELNQVLRERDGQQLPKVTVCPEERLFDCDLFVFTASRGVPGLDSGVNDVRMAQYSANRAMLAAYAGKAREARFSGLFCQVSDPVDQLARAVFLESNRDGTGKTDYAGLLPEQVQGFGLGVMAARAAYYAEREGVDFSEGRVYGPHGKGLIVANHCGAGYDDALSRRLTDLTQTANLRVRELGFKPYIAPGLSSAAVSLLRLLRGEDHYGAVPLGGTYFGCVSRFTPQGLLLRREELCGALMTRLTQTHKMLREFDQ